MSLTLLSTTWPAWATTGLPWLAVLVVLLLAGAVALLGLAVARLRAVDQSLRRLDAIEDLKRSVDKIAEGGDDLDVRRLEHVLIDIRDGQRRVEDGLIAVAEGKNAASLAGGVAAGASARPVELADRITTRLLALGYERVVLVTPLAELAEFVEADGEVVVEARRDGAICKGRVLVRGGRITEIQVQPAYSAFP